MNIAPIIITVYTRIKHFKRTIEALRKNSLAKDSELYIVSDAAYRSEDILLVEQVRCFAEHIEGFKKTHLLFWKDNLGPSTSWKKAIEIVLQNHDSFIGMEDDILVAPSYLQYLNDGLQFYKEDKKVFCICAFTAPFRIPKYYNKDVYFYNGLSPWGFAIWKDRYEKIDQNYYDRYFELKKNKVLYKKFLSIGFYIKGILIADSKGEIEADDMRWYYHMVKNDMCSVFPVVSKTQNWGFDGTGIHCNDKNYFWTKPELDERNQLTTFIPFKGYNEDILRNHRKFQDKINGGLIAKYLKYTWIYYIWKRLKHKK
ncbi:glycosyltransferase family protein [Parabacteroides provencensis]|uniref:glycosyltransferase n=1 Tax=Parabacteroides provencensis TaxID=1944636 RepID=UPI000C1449CA|nr:glycosyltransferase [Parabacteroides provencensis]